MSRDTGTGSNYVEIAVSITPTNPITYACRYLNNNTSQDDEGVVGIFDSSTSSNRSFVSTHSGGAGANVRLLTQGGANSFGYVGNEENDGEFNSVVVRLDTPSATDRHRLLLNGDLANEYSATVANIHPTTADRFSMGLLRDLTASNASDINGAEMALWTVALSDGEAAAYAAGVSPLLIRPGSLYAYAPLIRDLTDVCGNTTTESGTTVADHAPIIFPSRPQIITAPSVGAPPSFQPAWAINTTHVVGYTF